MKHNLVVAVLRLLIGDSTDLEYEDGEMHPQTQDPTVPDETAEADWMEYDPRIQSILAQTDAQA